MDNEKTPVCPKCGTIMVETVLDGSWMLDGSVTLGSHHCPKCSAASNAPEDVKE